MTHTKESPEYSGWFRLRGAAQSVNLNIPVGAPWVVADWNSDGRDDLLLRNGSSWDVYPSNGTTISSTVAESFPTAVSSDSFAADLSGDGFPELVQIVNGTLQAHKHKSALPDVVTTFTNGLGYSVDVFYEPFSSVQGLSGLPRRSYRESYC